MISASRAVLALLMVHLAGAAAAAPGVPPTNGVIDKRQAIASRPWLDNRDQDWYRANIPFVDTPDKVIDDT